MTLGPFNESPLEQRAMGVFAIGALLFSLLVTGCRSAPVLRIDCMPFTPQQGVTLEDLGAAFARGLHELRWRVLDDGRGPGRIHARHTWRSDSFIEVSVEYDLRCLSIRHIRSTGNFRYSEGEQTIHRTYNRTVRSLARRLVSKAETEFHFDLSEHEKYRGEGSGSLEGQAFLRQQGGGVVTCAGAYVILWPHTPYFQAAIGRYVRARNYGLLELPEVRDLALYTRIAQCDAEGDFRFENLPAAEWIAVTDVDWTVAGQRQGGLLTKPVTIHSDKTTDVLLTNVDR